MAGKRPFTVSYLIAVHCCKGPRCDSAPEPLPTIHAGSSDPAVGDRGRRVVFHIVLVQATTGGVCAATILGTEL
jgi:hypothetical protein